jgi:hypothetical protein
MPYQLVTPVYNPTVRKLCVHEYPNHPHGCPNFAHVDRCPPRAPLFPSVYDTAGDFYAIWSIFDLGAHVQRMRFRHPKWSDRQLRCVLYWQGTARKRLRSEINVFRIKHAFVREYDNETYLIHETPEALGVDVTATMKSIGIDLPWPPVDTVYHVALAGIAKGNHAA